MSIKLGKHSFSGPVTSVNKIKEWSGVYAIVCNVDGEFFVTDIGEGSKLRTRIENHCKKDCWKENCNGQLTIYIRYTPFLKKSGRILIEQELRELFHPDCKINERMSFPEILM